MVEDALDDRAGIYRQLFESAQVGLFRTRYDDGKMLAANEQTARMLGYPSCEDLLIGYFPRDRYVNIEDRLQILKGLQEHGEVHGFETRFRRLDGSVVWLRISAKHSPDHGWIQGLLEDVTDRKQAEIALRDSEERFRAIFESARDCVFVKGLDLRYTHVNPAMAELFGRPSEELIGVTDDDLFDSETAARVAVVDRRVLSGHAMEEVNTSAVGGVPHTFYTVKVPLRNPDNEVVGICGIARDITAFKRAESVERVLGAILHAAATSADLKTLISRIRDLLGALVDTTNFYVALYDDSTKRYSFPYYVDAYDALEQFEPHPLPKTLTDYVRRTGRPLLVDKAAFDELAARGEVELTGTDSEQWMGVPLVTDRGVIGVATVQSYHDPVLYDEKDLELLNYAAGTISIALERKRAEEKHRTLEMKVLQIQKMESLGVLAGGVAHEFNNLLQGMLGSTGLAAQQLPEDSRVHAQLERIEKAAADAAQLTRQMLAYSGKGRFIVEDIDLSELVESMRQLIEATVSRRARLEIEIDPELPLIRADESEIRQVILNLVSNASDALGEEQGTISIAAAAEECGRDRLRATFLGEELPIGRYVRLEVRDTGCGMDAAMLNKIFDPFFSTKFTGRGLGLAAVLGIVRANRGALTVASEAGSGTAIQVLLPSVFGVSVAEQEAEFSSDGDVEAETVLVVDDDEVVRSLAQQMLEEAGYTVMTAEDGQQALALFEQSPASFDAVLLDMTMPRMDGEATFKSMCDLRDDVHVIVSSGYSEQAAMERFVDPRPAGFLQKPYRYIELVDTVRRVCRERVPSA
jgi:PAS domain S-box-containing protein